MSWAIPQTVMTPSGVGLRVPRAAGTPDRWVIPALLCLAVLLVAGLVYNLAHLDTGGQPLPAGPGSEPPAPNFWGLILSNILTSVVAGGFLVLLLAVMLYALLTRKRRMMAYYVRPVRWWDTIGALILFAALVILLYYWPPMARNAANATSQQSAAGNNTFNATAVPTVGGVPLGVLLITAFILAIVVVTVLMDLSVRLQKMRPRTALASRRMAAAQAVGAAISELQLGQDVRTAILACYQRFCNLLGLRGILDQEALTPRELEDRAVTQLEVSPSSAESLTSLFEEARYSTHTLGDEDRDRAVESLARIREALEA